MSYVYKISLVSGKGVGVAFSGAGLTFMHYNSHYLTGIACLAIKDSTTNDSITVFTDIEHHVQWIRGLLNKHVRKYTTLLISIKMFNYCIVLVLLMTISA